MYIDFAYDTICPWSFITKRRLQKVLADRTDFRAIVNWQPFLLNRKFQDFESILDNNLTFNINRELDSVQARMSIIDAGKPLGINFNFENLKPLSNTIDSHKLIKIAQTLGCGMEVIDQIFKHYFEYGNDIGSISLLRKIGSEEGLDYNVLKEFPNKNKDFDQVNSFNSVFQQYEIHGIPTLIFDKKFVISGAQDIIVLERMIDISLENTKELL
jgi:predicted DsbA family dithiol-disulfide isomerase